MRTMNTELVLLFCLVAIPMFYSVPIDVLDVPLNRTEVQATSRDSTVPSKPPISSTGITATVQGGSDRVVSPYRTDNTSDSDTGDSTTTGTNVPIKDAGTNDLMVPTAINSSVKNQRRAVDVCSNLNQEQTRLCQHALIADFKLDQIYNLLSTIVKTCHPSPNSRLTSQEVTNHCTINITRLTYDLRTAITAVCLLDNVTETVEEVGGCCHSGSHKGEEFHQFVEFLQANVFRLFNKEFQMDDVDPICLDQDVNVAWLGCQLTHTLQHTKLLLTAIESRQCFVV